MASRIAETFRALKKQGRKAFIPYIMAGDPSLKKTASLIKLLERAGADIIELGVPFSDPLADGPVIQAAASRALQAGVTLKDVIKFVGEIRKTTSVPLVLMTYYNPVFRLGVERFARMAAGAGVDGLIIPDLPFDEAGEIKRHCRAHGLDSVFLAAPTSGANRLRRIAKASTGFIYFVSITGITGAKLVLPGAVKRSIRELAGYAGEKKAVAVGFGVATPEEAQAVARLADGVIVGSAIVRKAREGSTEALKRYVEAMRKAIR